MTGLKRRFAMSSVVLAAFALGGTTGLCAEDNASGQGGPATKISFGPVIERVLPTEGPDAQCFLDLDTGKLHILPEGIAGNKDATDAWCLKNGIDIRRGKPVEGAGHFEMLDIKNLQMQMKAACWEESPQVVAGNVGRTRRLRRVLLPYDASTTLFGTREGSTGVLQIVGPGPDGRGVKIRYKMVEPPVAAGKPAKEGWGEEVFDLQFGIYVGRTSCRPGEKIAVRYRLTSDIGGFRVCRKPASLALTISGPDRVQKHDWWAAYWAKREKPELPWAFYTGPAAYPTLFPHLGHVEIVFNPLEVGHRVTFSKPGVYRLRATYAFDGVAVNARHTWAHTAWEGGSVISNEVTVTVTDTEPNRGESATKPEPNMGETSQESETREIRTTLAKDSVHCVQMVVYPPDKLGLEVLGPTGEVRWKTQPSSTNIKVGLHQNRIVIFNKTRAPGILDLDRPAPTRGATIYTLAGETIGTLPECVHDGEFVGGVFLGKMVGRGVIAFRLDDAKELWRNNDVLRANWISLAGPGLLNLRCYDDRENEFINHVLCLRSGKTLFEISSPRDENVKVLAASKDRYVTLRTIMKDPGTAYWISDILDNSGQKTAEIRALKGMPIQACFSRDGQTLAMICVAADQGDGVNQTQYTLQIYTSQGKQLQETKLLTSDADRVLEASMIFDSRYVRTTLTRKEDVNIKVSP
ncbi:MAG TPA: hypothetical protein VMY42_18965 [Thermoguttaceae bacterium]|nr:hypothetical protein [Thermoguttaceae bacterium]